MQRLAQRVATLSLATVVAGIGFGLRPVQSLAATYEELQKRVEESNAAYDAALANMDRIQDEIDENEERISQLEADLPAQRQRAATSLRALYKIQQGGNGLIDLLLAADDFNEFITTITYLDHIQDKHMDAIDTLNETSSELAEREDLLAARKAQADQEAEAARQAQEEAVQARDDLVAQAMAKAREEEEAARKALEEAQRKAAEEKKFKTKSGQEVPVSAPKDTTSIADSLADTTSSTTPSPSDPTGSTATGREAFVAKWAGRIDNYLAGSPLGGHGKTFAEAAWDYGVDPRWSPAISTVESSQGAVCFLPHNAWGWGDVSWPDWDTAIREHVAGLSAGYGYTLTVSAAHKYCEDGDFWYASVAAEMACI